jgi:formylglycine-generating enzyme
VTPISVLMIAGAGLALGGLCVTLQAPASDLPNAVASPPAAPATRAEPPDCSAARTESPTLALLPVPSAPYRPFFKGNLSPTSVSAFRLATAPVTRADFLAFVKCHPEWRRSRAKASLSEAAYLSDFASDLEPGALPLDEPVRFVSWFAARAFCESRGERLPTTIEWERALGSNRDPAGPAGSGATAPSFDFAMGRAAADLSASELRAQGVWEWTSDFNSTPVAGGAAASQFCGDGIRSNAPSDYAAFLRYSFRSSLKAGYALKNLGFRCARDGAS